jgi:hypothetical protein
VRGAPEFNELIGAKSVAVHDDRFHHLGQHVTLFAVQDVLLLLGQGHLVRRLGGIILDVGERVARAVGVVIGTKKENRTVCNGTARRAGIAG